jgi:hypothetical protein
MPILPAKRLGPYEVLSAIAAGGRGEVYRIKPTTWLRTTSTSRCFRQDDTQTSSLELRVGLNWFEELKQKVPSGKK